jgi:succinate dehydrogenase/fumarate reductase cytochrome b subunit
LLKTEKKIMEREGRMEYRRPLKWNELDPYRRGRTEIGMWAWIFQRISALAIIVLLVLHLTLTYIPIIQFLLLMAVTFHAALGVRVILLDFNVVNVKYQKLLIYGLLGLGVVAFIIIWESIY